MSPLPYFIDTYTLSCFPSVVVSALYLAFLLKLLHLNTTSIS